MRLAHTGHENKCYYSLDVRSRPTVLLIVTELIIMHARGKTCFGIYSTKVTSRLCETEFNVRRTHTYYSSL